MRAKVTLTRDLEDIPDLIVEQIQQSKKIISSLASQKFNYLQPEVLLKQISQYRLALSDVDTALEDAQNLTVGYIDTVTPQAPEEEEVEEEGI